MLTPRIRALLFLPMLALAALSPSAHAAITASEITASNVPKFNYTDDNAPEGANDRTVSGTAAGKAGDLVHVGCFVGNANKTTINVTALRADGTWTATGALDGVDEPCVLRAIPPNAPADLTPFKPGQTVYASSFYVRRHGTSGKAFDWGVEEEPRERGYADYYSLGDCGLCDMSWRDEAGRISQRLFYYNASTGSEYAFDPDGTGPKAAESRPQVTVDGVQAYAPWNAESGAGLDAFVGLTFSRDVDPLTGDATTRSTEALMTCPGNDCSAAVADTGIRFERTTLYDHDGRVFRVDDVVRNTSGAAREIDLGMANWQPGNATGVQLPGESAFSARRNVVVPIAPAPTSSIVVKYDNGVAIDPLTNPVGTITTAPAADAAEFTNSANGFNLRWKFTLAPGATKKITQVFSMGGTLEATKALAAEAEDGFVAPTVTIDAPADGATTDKDRVMVSGTAADNSGVSVKVNGSEAPVSGGRWSSTVALKQGENTITAVARDAAGNTASATRRVTYAPPKPADGGKPAAATTTTQPAPAPGSVRPPAATPRAAVVTTAARPLVRGRGSRLTVHTGVTVACPAGGPACSAVVSPTHKRAQIGRASLVIPAGRSARVSFRLTKGWAKTLRAKRSLRVLVGIVTRAGAGAPQTTTRTLTIRAPRARK